LSSFQVLISAAVKENLGQINKRAPLVLINAERSLEFNSGLIHTANFNKTSAVIIKCGSGFRRYPDRVCEEAFGGSRISCTISDDAKVSKRFLAARIDSSGLCEKLLSGISIATLKSRATLSNKRRRPIVLPQSISLGQYDFRD
jgi:hypothetical protein